MKKTKKQLENHPFFSHKHNCRKTVWETPEFLTEDDWTFLEQIIPFLVNNEPEKMDDFLCKRENKLLTKRFFDQTIGWPEGHTYCLQSTYFVKVAFPSMKQYKEKRLVELVEKHKKGKII